VTLGWATDSGRGWNCDGANPNAAKVSPCVSERLAVILRAYTVLFSIWAVLTSNGACDGQRTSDRLRASRGETSPRRRPWFFRTALKAESGLTIMSPADIRSAARCSVMRRSRDLLRQRAAKAGKANGKKPARRC